MVYTRLTDESLQGLFKKTTKFILIVIWAYPAEGQVGLFASSPRSVALCCGLSAAIPYAQR
jgi:hypothetical protein